MIRRERLEKAKSFVRVLLPGYALLCDFDSGNPIISFAYHRVLACIQDIKDADDNAFDIHLPRRAAASSSLMHSSFEYVYYQPAICVHVVYLKSVRNGSWIARLGA